MDIKTNERKIRISQLVLTLGILIGIAAITWFESGRTEPADHGEYQRYEDLNGKSVAVVTGSSYADFAEEYLPDSERIYVSDWADTSMLVSQGRAECLITERADADTLLQEYPLLTALPDVMTHTEYSFVTQHTAQGADIAKEFNTFLKEIMEDGSFDQIRSKWIERTGDVNLEPCNSHGSKGVLRITTSDDWTPYAYVSNGEIAGVFPDVAYRFCEWAGYTPELYVLPFNSSYMGIITGKYDLLAYGYVASQERAEEVNFTDPLAGDDVLVIVRKTSVAGHDREINTSAQTERRNLFQTLSDSFEKNFIRESRWKMLASGLVVTVALSVFAAIFGTLLGALICWMNLSHNSYGVGFARMYVKFFQGMPIVVLLLLLYYIVFGKINISAFLVCVLGFSLDFSAYCAEIFRNGISSVPPGQQKAALALGFSKAAAFRNVVLPQAMQHILPVYRGQFVSMVKMTSVAGYISVRDLTKISDIIRSRTYEAFFPLISTAVIYFLLAALLVSVLRCIEGKTDPLRRSREPKGVRR